MAHEARPLARDAIVAALARDAIVAALARLAPGHAGEVVVHASTGSTNDDARALAAQGCEHGSLVTADAQTRGRGRSGQRWHSPPGANVYLSVVLRPRLAPHLATPFTLCVGLVVAELVEARIGRPASLKWPNDVLVDGRKIAGVLVEAQIRGDRLASVVVGVGLDVETLDFPPPLDAIATSLAQLGAVDRNRSILVAELTARIVEAASRFEAHGLATFLPAVAARDALAGTRVRVGDVEGLARGIADDGALLVAQDDGRLERVVAGTVERLRE
jgi:BirA family biotin operon repressor/biotin-[acetyl-CoA-carboxylase] ligase